VKRSKTRELPPTTPGCLGCAARDKRIEELETAVAQQRATFEAAIARLEAKIAVLEERLAQNSKNSHRPPSSDPLNVPPKRRPKSGRKRGGQLGHKGKKRGLFPPEEVDRFVDHRPSSCDRCGKHLPEESGPGDPKPHRHQVIDLPERPREVTEHRAHACRCECGHINRATIPEEIIRSSFGPRLVAAVGFLTGACQLSRRQAQETLQDVFGIEISLGSIKNLEHEMSEALAESVEEAAEVVRAAPAKNVDETGWKKSGWLWVAGTARLAFFAIGNRGKQGFRDLIGQKVLGVFTSDRWAVYNAAVKNRFRQVCWSHLLRDFEKLIGRGGEPSRIGEEAKSIGADLFLVWKDFKTGEIDREALKRCLRPCRRQLKDVLTRGAKLTHAKSATFCENLLALEPALWTFLRVEDVEPTNNHAERLLRRGVLWRKKSFGSPSERGCLFVTRILTAVQSRRIQTQPVYPFLIRAVTANRAVQPAPSLVTG